MAYTLYLGWTRNFSNMYLILINGLSLTDHSNSAVEAVSAQGTPNDGLLPGYYNGLQWPIRGRSARKGYLFQASDQVHERVAISLVEV